MLLQQWSHRVNTALSALTTMELWKNPAQLALPIELKTQASMSSLHESLKAALTLTLINEART